MVHLIECSWCSRVFKMSHGQWPVKNHNTVWFTCNSELHFNLKKASEHLSSHLYFTLGRLFHALNRQKDINNLLIEFLLNVDTSRSYHSLRNNVFPRMFDVRFIPCKHRWPIMMTATWVYGYNPLATVNRCTFNKSSKSILKYMYFLWHFWWHQKMSEKF